VLEGNEEGKNVELHKNISIPYHFEAPDKPLTMKWEADKEPVYCKEERKD